MNKMHYSDLFWLFVIGNLTGVVIEGIFCIFRYGHWETHTVTVWGPFCIIYGIGAVALYVGATLLKNKNLILQFIVFSIVATVVEYLCGALLKYGLRMMAWDYSGQFLNFDGLVCPLFTLGWGVAGIVFSKWLMPLLHALLSKTHGKAWNILCICMSVFMAINLLITSVCILRWSNRHRGLPPSNSMGQYIDETWNDERMQKKFCEWRFIE